MRRMIAGWMVGLVVVAAGCASSGEHEEEQEVVYVEAEPSEPPEPPPPEVVPVPVAQPLPGQVRPAPPADTPSEEAVEEATNRPASEVINEANERARSTPVEEGYFNAVQVYDFVPGALYQVYAAEGRVTTLQFGEGEQVRSVAMGDTVRWVVGRTKAGQGASAQELVLIKPVRSGLETNAVVTTDRRTYQLELCSTEDTYMASVSWHYPAADVHRFAMGGVEEVEEITADVREDASPEEVQRGPRVGTQIENLNFDWGFVVDDPDAPPEWKPERVFDDGRHTYIQFPRWVRERELPAFFVLSQTGAPEVTNYRMEGDYMVVDHVFERGQLRMADEEVGDESVGIERLGE